MTNPHIPSWLETAVAVVVADYEAEAVFLVGPHAPDDAHSTPVYDLLTIVDNDRVLGLEPIVELRTRALSGFERPVTVIPASLAELMAGLYSGHSEWASLAADAFPLFDPMGVAARLEAQLASTPSVDLAAHLSRSRADATRAEQLRSHGQELAAGLLLVQSALRLVHATAAHTGHRTVDPSRSIAALGRFSPGAARALVSLLTGATFDQQLEALHQMAAAIESAQRLKGG